MANNYLQFSTLLDVGSAENARTALAWLDDESNPVGFEFPYERGFVATTEGCEAGAIFLYAEEYGDPDNLMLFARTCAVEFGLTGKWGFTWAETCSKPVPDEFGGGALVLDFETGRCTSATLAAWLRDRLA